MYTLVLRNSCLNSITGDLTTLRKFIDDFTIFFNKSVNL